MKHVLVTGGAGFIGSHLVDRLLARGLEVTAIDNFDPFYDQSIKENNIRAHLQFPRYTLVRGEIRDYTQLKTITKDIDVLVHLAAKAGVRPSIADPMAYQDVNVRGTQCLLEFAKERRIPHFVFASSSSVYGVNPRVPWAEDDHGLLPISPYASTKVSGELLGHVYSHLYGMRFIALRFFTVYGPRQRPDLAIHKMARLLMKDQPIPIFGTGDTRRDYTFIDDIIEGIEAAIGYDQSQFEVINLGNNHTVGLLEMVKTIEDVFGKSPQLEFLPEQPGDVPRTWADISKAQRLLKYQPRTKFRDGITKFRAWMAESEG